MRETRLRAMDTCRNSRLQYLNPQTALPRIYCKAFLLLTYIIPDGIIYLLLWLADFHLFPRKYNRITSCCDVENSKSTREAHQIVRKACKVISYPIHFSLSKYRPDRKLQSRSHPPKIPRCTSVAPARLNSPTSPKSLTRLYNQINNSNT